MRDRCKIYNCDAEVVLTALPDNSVDLIVTDPPYNTTNLVIDKQGFNLSSYVPSLKRVLKPAGWFFCCNTIMMQIAIIDAGLFRNKFDYVWEKPQGIVQHPGVKAPMRAHEIMSAYIPRELKTMSKLYMDKKALRNPGKKYSTIRHSKTETVFRTSQGISMCPDIIDRDWREGTTVLKFPNKPCMAAEEKTAHPTQKPLAMIELLCRGYCPAGGVVLDPFCGSGTTVLAARNTGRIGLGSELDKEFFDMAIRRLVKK